MKFDGTVTLGSVLTMIAMLTTGFLALSDVQSKLAVLNSELQWVKANMAARDASRDVALAKIEARVNELYWPARGASGR